MAGRQAEQQARLSLDTLRDGKRALSTVVNGLGVHLGRNKRTRTMVLTFPIADERFRPVDTLPTDNARALRE